MVSDGRRLPLAALGFAIAAAASSWTPLAAPFGFLVGAGALALATVALRRGARRAEALSALAIAAAAIVASALVLALTAGVGREMDGTPVVAPPRRGSVRSELDAAAERTRGSRERARSELDAAGGGETRRGAEPRR